MQSYFLAVVFALASAFTIAWGTVIRHRIVAQSGDGSPLLTGMKRPLWWISIFSAQAAYLLQVVALGFGTLLVVQPILVMSLMFTLLLAAHLNGQKMERHDTMWASILTVAVGILVIYGRPQPGDGPADTQLWWLAVVIGIAVCLALVVVAYRFPGTKALSLGAACGIIFGYVAVLSKSVADLFIEEGTLALFMNWQLYALIVAAIFGTAVQQYAFAAGRLETTLPAMKIFEPIVGFSLGYAILGETFQVSGILGWSVMGASLVAMFLATFALARRQVA